MAEHRTHRLRTAVLVVLAGLVAGTAVVRRRRLDAATAAFHQQHGPL